MQRLGIIGCGLRSNAYMVHLKDGLGTDWDVAGLADPNPKAVDYFRDEYAAPSTPAFPSGPEMLDALAGRLDAVIIGSPNALHRESLLPALEQNLKILLEKPVATTMADMKAIWSAYEAAGKPSVPVGFVLRYTGFYRKVQEVLDSGRLGTLFSIHATEEMGPSLTALYMRGWRRNTAVAGPLLAEKCSHDIDLLNAFAGGRPVRISSFSGLTRFVPMPNASDHCRDCTYQDSCRYSTKHSTPYMIDAKRTAAPLRRMMAENDLCVYNSDKNIPDHQSVLLDYENSVTVTFTVSMDQPRTNRHIKITGSDATLTGNLSDDRLSLEYHGRPGTDDPQHESFVIAHDDSGHHGGDSVISDYFKAMLKGTPNPPPAGLQEGIESCLVCLAAQVAADTGRVIDVPPYYTKIFG